MILDGTVVTISDTSKNTSTSIESSYRVNSKSTFISVTSSDDIRLRSSISISNDTSSESLQKINDETTKTYSSKKPKRTVFAKLTRA